MSARAADDIAALKKAAKVATAIFIQDDSDENEMKMMVANEKVAQA